MKLSERLEMVLSFVETGESAADVGTDHGHVPERNRKKGSCDGCAEGTAFPCSGEYCARRTFGEDRDKTLRRGGKAASRGGGLGRDRRNGR